MYNFTELSFYVCIGMHGNLIDVVFVLIVKQKWNLLCIRLVTFMNRIVGDQLAIGKETGRRLGMGTNMYPSSALLGESKNGDLATISIDKLIEKADGFAGVFPG